MIGADPENASPRLIFGHYELFDGLPLPAVALGMLAISEIVTRLARNKGISAAAINLSKDGDPSNQRVSWTEYWSCRYTMLRGAVIGTLLGATPGIGSTAAAFMSYSATKAASKDPDSFGKGNIQGVAATESANSAVVGANLIPLLTLGIPGSVSAALIISAFMIHGIQPGPLLFKDQGRLIYGLFGAMVMANFLNLWIGQIGLRIWVKVISAPQSFIYVSAIMLCIVGVSMAAGGLFSVTIMLLFALLGYIMTRYGFSIVIFIIAFFLGPRFEISVAQSNSLMSGDWTRIVEYPIAIALLVLSVITLFFILRGSARRAAQD